MSPLEYLHLQLQLEGKQVINRDRLRQVKVVPGEEMPLVLLAALSSGEQLAYVDELLSAELYDRLSLFADSLVFPAIDPIVEFLRSKGILSEADHYKTYGFPIRYRNFSLPLVNQYSKRNPRVQAFGFDGFAEEVYGIEQEQKIISACVSARENDFCGEAWVYTADPYRRQGLAQKVVGAWASNLIAANKIALYSHKIRNVASANLAKHLGLQPLFEEIVISRAV